ncbi:hypothetical protein CONCODRAFT_17238 [Conidiobolus coronatus NRRL 28638]|uniref:F-box domain-containing protein n=1 Tax=Conidiobolus coronatus (strain ATCC 28846 / CBS 209.66 / NRRL 28638) TaxID=796925 RepID=A0A137P7R8_CONC2|nr:hypothetical protein CONCODRAFT_17238 [Conidiobolus coronatus NRRL 28638]|eukprot:KXN70971.1 hypothetical protein CONCODRAFT_17238 [Conidiobolus coronatus NRRL 28638]
MDKIDRAFLVNVFCNRDLIQYLSNKDKCELSSACKQFYQSYTKWRLQSYTFTTFKLIQLANILELGDNSENGVYNSQLITLNTIIDKHKKHILQLTSVHNINYFIVEYFSINFTYLTKLRLYQIALPMDSLQNIFKNLPKLRSLTLERVMLAYCKLEDQDNEIQLPKLLTSFNYDNCRQFVCDIKEPADLYQNASSQFNNLPNMRFDCSSIGMLKSLSWVNRSQNDTSIINQLLANNFQLEKFEAPLQCLNSNSLSLIANNQNLNTFSLSNNLTAVNFTYYKFINLPYIKAINLQIEKLKLFCIKLEYESRTFLSQPLPESSLECLQLQVLDPYDVNFQAFVNLKNLKTVKITLRSNILPNHDSLKSYYAGFKGWRLLLNQSTINLWKI